MDLIPDRLSLIKERKMMAPPTKPKGKADKKVAVNWQQVKATCRKKHKVTRRARKIRRMFDRS